MAIINNGIYINGVSPIPPEESEWVLYQTFTTTTAWTVPESNWYRIFCVGKSADGQRAFYPTWTIGADQTVFWGGGVGGNSGAIAVSALKLEKGEVYNITITSSLTSFADLLSAEAGTSATTYGNSSVSQGNSFNHAGGIQNPTIARAYGGNVVNADGFLGGNGAQLNDQPQIGGNNGGRVVTGTTWNNRSSGGGGARYSDLAPINKYTIKVSDLAYPGAMAGGQAVNFSTSTNGYDFYNWSAPNVILSGGGGGAASEIRAGGSVIVQSTGSGGKGQPGLVIIEKGK